MYNPYQFQNPYQPQFNINNDIPKYEVIHVNGENGARALQMAPNSNALLLDDTAPIVWLAQTDGAGYKTVNPYTITPYKPEQPVDMKSLEDRISRLEEIINDKSNTTNTKRKQTKQPTTDDTDD